MSTYPPDLVLASTTDTQEALNEAAGLTATPEETQEETQETSEGAEEQPGTETDSETVAAEDEPEEKPKPKSKGGFQKKIDKLTRLNYEAEQRAAKLEEELNALKAKAPETKATDDAEPKEEDFKDFKEYLKAMNRWTVRQELKAKESKEAEAVAKEQQQQTADSYNKGVSAARGAHEDFDEVVTNSNMNLPKSVIDAVIDMGDQGAEVAYYLGKNPDFCEHLLEVSPLAAVREVGRVYDKLFPPKASPEPKKPVSGAPAPIKPLASAATKSSVPLGELDVDEYIRVRNQQVRARKGR